MLLGDDEPYKRQCFYFQPQVKLPRQEPGEFHFFWGLIFFCFFNTNPGKSQGKKSFSLSGGYSIV